MIPPTEPAQEPPEAPPLPPGTALGSYVLADRIGYGAMGAVYRAEHTLLKKSVAIKVMAAPLLDSADARERFLREGQTAAALKHPNVVDVTDVGVAGTMPFLVMELLEGEDLEAFLERRKQLEEWEVAELIVPIVAALASAHAQGVVHRDLKPSNIFVARGIDAEITPKVLDFGICKLAQTLDGPDLEATPFNQLMGSPSYLSPESLKGSCHVSDRCDQYSLGVVLYECVTARKPFFGETLFSLLSAIHNGEFARPRESRPDVSAVMEGIILRAMQVDPQARFADMRELGRALLAVARPRTQMLWGPVFGYESEPSGELPALSRPLEGSSQPVRQGAQRRTLPISRHMAWALGLVLLGCIVAGLRMIWRAPTAKGVPINAALLARIPIAARAEAVAVPIPAPAEAVPVNAAALPVNAAAPLISAELRLPAGTPVAPETGKSSPRKGASRHKLKLSNHRTPPALLLEIRQAAGLAPIHRAPGGLGDGRSSATLPNEAPILD